MAPVLVSLFFSSISLLRVFLMRSETIEIADRQQTLREMNIDKTATRTKKKNVAPLVPRCVSVQRRNNKRKRRHEEAL